MVSNSRLKPRIGPCDTTYAVAAFGTLQIATAAKRAETVHRVVDATKLVTGDDHITQLDISAIA